MSFTLRWSPKALHRLADLWWAAPEPRTMLEAIERINVLLRVDPVAQGESRDGEHRILLDYPLGVLYQIEPISSSVDILNVWRFDKRPKRT